MFKLLRNGLLRYILHTCPILWCNSCSCVWTRICPSSSSSNTLQRCAKKVRNELVSSGLDFTKMGSRLSFYIKMSVLLTGASWRADHVVANKGSKSSNTSKRIALCSTSGSLQALTFWPQVMSLQVASKSEKQQGKHLELPWVSSDGTLQPNGPLCNHIIIDRHPRHLVCQGPQVGHHSRASSSND